MIKEDPELHGCAPAPCVPCGPFRRFPTLLIEFPQPTPPGPQLHNAAPCSRPPAPASCPALRSKIEAQTRQVLSGKDINDLYEKDAAVVGGVGRGGVRARLLLISLIRGGHGRGGAMRCGLWRPGRVLVCGGDWAWKGNAVLCLAAPARPRRWTRRLRRATACCARRWPRSRANLFSLDSPGASNDTLTRPPRLSPG